MKINSNTCNRIYILHSLDIEHVSSTMSEVYTCIVNDTNPLLKMIFENMKTILLENSTRQNHETKVQINMTKHISRIINYLSYKLMF